MSKHFVIHDTTPHDVIFPREYGRGLDLSQRDAAGYAGIADPFPDSLLIPRSEWQAHIQERERKKNRLSDVCDQANLPCLNQEQTPYCWCNAPTYCVEVMRVIQNQPLVLLSPASVGGPITNFQSVGGWGNTALKYIVQYGICPQTMWPANAIDPQYYTAQNQKLATGYRCTAWWDLNGGNVVDNVVSCLLRGFPVAVGLSWWQHEISYIDPVWLDGDIAIKFRNSWGMSWQDRGYAVLQGQRMIPDDAVAPRVMAALDTRI